MVEFCKKCKNIMIPKGKSLRCNVCGFSIALSQEKIKDYSVKTETRSKKQKYNMSGVVLRKAAFLTDEVRDFRCKYCGCEKGFYSAVHLGAFSKTSKLLIICSNCRRSQRENSS
jgi:DNA-directed RNA polymerase subunit M